MKARGFYQGSKPHLRGFSSAFAILSPPTPPHLRHISLMVCLLLESTCFENECVQQHFVLGFHNLSGKTSCFYNAYGLGACLLMVVQTGIKVGTQLTRLKFCAGVGVLGRSWCINSCEVLRFRSAMVTRFWCRPTSKRSIFGIAGNTCS